MKRNSRNFKCKTNYYENNPNYDGAPALGNRGRKLFFVLDQVESIAGGLLAVLIFVPVPLSTAVTLLLLGAVTHYVFNFVLMHMGLRARAA